MFQRLKEWHEKRVHKKAIQNAMRILRSVYPNVRGETRSTLVQSVWDLVADYEKAYGAEDGIAKFYFNHISHVVGIMERKDGNA